MIWLLFLVGGTLLNPITLAIGSLLPDADIKKAPAGKILPLWLLFNHRTWTHTLWGLLLASLITWWMWNSLAGISLAVGYFSHLMLDACTPSGVGWLKPRKFYRR